MLAHVQGFGIGVDSLLSQISGSLIVSIQMKPGHSCALELSAGKSPLIEPHDS